MDSQPVQQPEPPRTYPDNPHEIGGAPAFIRQWGRPGERLVETAHFLVRKEQYDREAILDDCASDYRTGRTLYNAQTEEETPPSEEEVASFRDACAAFIDEYVDDARTALLPPPVAYYEADDDADDGAQPAYPFEPGDERG